MKILLTGCNGQFGFKLKRALAPLGEIAAIDRAACDRADADQIEALLGRMRPNLIVNAAAYTAVDKAESEPKLTRAVNDVAPRILGEWGAEIGVPVIHYSTDFVYDGGSPSETQRHHPRRWRRHPAVPGHALCFQAAPAGL
ncbi:MAG: sugar nucleotide-binding protein [Azovibrio sp.]|nr:sugar nucleotide-binding protein [Azovibrio sp.]